jgi:hypothetical protein
MASCPFVKGSKVPGKIAVFFILCIEKTKVYVPKYTAKTEVGYLAKIGMPPMFYN